LAGAKLAYRDCAFVSAAGEVPLPSYQWATATDPIDEAHPGRGRGRGVDAAVCGHAGPDAG